MLTFLVKKIKEWKIPLVRCALSMIRSDSRELVKAWLSFILEFLKFYGIPEELREELKGLVYRMIDKIEFDYTKMAGICLWTLLYEVRKKFNFSKKINFEKKIVFRSVN